MLKVKRRQAKEIRKQAAGVRRRLGTVVEPSGNGHSRSAAIMDLQRRRRRLPRRWLVLAVLVLVGTMGARKCKVLEPLNDPQRLRARLDIYIGCYINDCSRDQVQQLLDQLDAMPSDEER